MYAKLSKLQLVVSLQSLSTIEFNLSILSFVSIQGKGLNDHFLIGKLVSYKTTGSCLATTWVGWMCELWSSDDGTDAGNSSPLCSTMYLQ